MKTSQFPQFIYNEITNLYKKLYQHLNIKSPTIRATAIYYFYKFYQKSSENTPEYAITAISCFHLATKVCEVPISFKRLINEIKHSTQSGITSSFVSIFRVLDGIPPSSTPNFNEILLKKFHQKEIQIIVTLNFNFIVQLPYDISTIMIEKILKWHINSNDPKFKLLQDELIGKIWPIFNDLQTKELFYVNSPELISLSVIDFSFLLFDLPLISPKHSPWYTFLVPDVDPEEFNQLTSEIKEIFSSLLHISKGSHPFHLKTQIDKNTFNKWIKFPLIPLKKIPICDPPKLELLESIVSNNDSFKRCNCDHVPTFPPPQLSSQMNSNNLKQLKSEYEIYLKH